MLCFSANPVVFRQTSYISPPKNVARPLNSKYQQYKNDTDVVATRLANTSKSFGYEDLGIGATNLAANSGRLKASASR